MEYEVLTKEKIKDKIEEAGGKIGWLVGQNDPELWGGALNAYAREGWVVITSYVLSKGDSGGEITVILGRPVN